MNNLLDNRFEKVEKALATLINSIATYNPSTSNASDLVAADAELNDGLEQLSTHQANYAKIIALRETSNALDAEIRDTLTLLSTTRRDLIATPATSFPPNANPISYSELLSYARRISRFTLPPTYRDPQASAAETGDAATNTSGEPNQQIQTNGINTPVVATNGELHNTAATDLDKASPAAAAQMQPQPSQHEGVRTNLSIWEQYLNPSAEMPFFPWPSEESIRKGALASLQVLVDQGIDPATFDPEKSAELEAERKRIMEEEDAAREQERIKEEEARRREMERRMSAGGPAPERREEKTEAFQFSLMDDSD
ncbi:uncharacterized protein L3040_002165 [Drepanopeziza brunnea f. sp. 'multigermtubi']|uniref:Mediator of RNA polymerase II transcription subunit 4 n=1 Tax=Marssonina brunnea f. sp. multigermtubi (strain MB_m1) TaxID=1072389 RepID=K1WJG0_MARBU|nr:Mediator of RNA polymerase II transcription subunit 4 [Drepanopeziza brunnea f. sp. 'multigermtubi' MB_m1]EKD17795.1 Mediator of RNA polymerase II transcription subunit 4 [Drepanopeziza brunnea f. sp. 'multigermtubi' MB_m1]KAJ5052416.1 hypothetical protein L3040_002165 [Drepanopeziza brunnea f. sp. 'multigermtubi']